MGALVWVLVLVVLLPTAYFTPAVVAVSRSHRHADSIFVINLLLGWTFIGWGVALAMSVSGFQPRDTVDMRPVISLLVCAASFACISAYSLYNTITLDLKPTDERLYLCGKAYVTPCADRFEYAWAAGWTAAFALTAAGLFTAAALRWRALRRQAASNQKRIP